MDFIHAHNIGTDLHCARSYQPLPLRRCSCFRPEAGTCSYLSSPISARVVRRGPFAGIHLCVDPLPVRSNTAVLCPFCPFSAWWFTLVVSALLHIATHSGSPFNNTVTRVCVRALHDACVRCGTLLCVPWFRASAVGGPPVALPLHSCYQGAQLLPDHVSMHQQASARVPGDSARFGHWL